jgi:hypothetical protein
MNKIQLLEMLVYDRLDELIEKGELKNSQVYKDSDAEVELTYVGSQLFCYWYDHYSELFENHEREEVDGVKDKYTIEIDNPFVPSSTEKSTRTMIDPPSGWRFGFPKEIPKEILQDNNKILNWLVDNGYPQSEIDIFKEDGLPYRIYEI